MYTELKEDGDIPLIFTPELVNCSAHQKQSRSVWTSSYSIHFCLHIGIDGVQLLIDDILLTEQQRTLFELANQNSDPNRSQRAVVSQGILKWKDGIVPYIIDDSLSKCENLTVVCTWWHVVGGWKCNVHISTESIWHYRKS